MPVRLPKRLIVFRQLMRKKRSEAQEKSCGGARNLLRRQTLRKQAQLFGPVLLTLP